jgi:hypothetical protein
VVLTAQGEVENGLVAFLRSQQRATLLDESVDAAEKAVHIVLAQKDVGAIDFNRYALIAQNLVQQQDSRAQSRGDIALGLIQVYRALGGAWQVRLESEEPLAEVPALPPALPPTPPPATREAPAEKKPAEKAPTEKAPAEKTPADKAPAKKATAEKASADLPADGPLPERHEIPFEPATLPPPGPRPFDPEGPGLNPNAGP